ncbi:MAG: HAMP domain-containing histidine kinase [Prolixibacteraceae bacterium]|nr:HAMP domain-containing histidine kinase [Prolixibacteraceae bacterium]
MKVEQISFENRVFLQTCLIVSVIMFISGILNVILGLDTIVIVLSFGISLFSLFAFWYSRKTFRFDILKPIVTILYIGLTNAGWYFNYASEGPILGIFIILVIFLSFIWDQRTMVLINAFILFNLMVLFYIDWEYPHLMLQYQSREVKLVDQYVGNFFFLVLVAFFSWFAKNNYQKKYDEALLSEEIKNQFLQNLSHDIKTPVNSILGFTQLLKDPSIDQLKKETSVKYIETNSHYMLSIINDLMALLSIDHQKVSINETVFDIHQLMTNMKVEMEVTISPRQQIKLIYEKEYSGQALMIKTDEVKLKRILTNLINNALKFTKAGEIKFDYRMITNQLIEFYVSDTGKGIEPKDQELIFERFRQSDEAHPYFNSGIGLGLSICKHYSSLLGGNINVESVPGKGSTFSFTIINHLNNSATDA